MKHEREQTRLRVFLQNTDKASWWAAAQDALLKRALARGLRGATTLEGVAGVVGGEMVESGRWAIVQHRPVILEFLDSTRAIATFLPDVAEAAPRALVTMKPVRVFTAGAADNPDPPPSPEEFPTMRTATGGHLLRVHIDDSDTREGHPLYRAVLEKVRALGIANAVVLRASKGFGTHHRLHTDSTQDYDSEQPLVIEVVGTPEEVARLMPFLDEAVPEGLVTVEDVTLLRGDVSP